MGKGKPWWAKFKSMKGEYSSLPHVPHDVLEEMQLAKMRRDNETDERIKYIGLGVGGGDSLQRKVNDALRDTQGEYVALQVVSSGMAYFAILVYRPPKPSSQVNTQERR